MELRYWAASQPLPNVGLHFGYCHKKTTGFRGAAPAGELSPVERPRLTEIETKSLYHMKDETGFSTILHLSFCQTLLSGDQVPLRMRPALPQWWHQTTSTLTTRSVSQFCFTKM